MKQKKLNLSKRTLALGAVAVLLFASGGFMGTRAQLTTFSQDYNAEFELDHLQVHLLENGRDVCGGANTIDGSTKVSDCELLQYLGYAYNEGNPTPGDIEPGRVYQEEITAQNSTDIDQFLRLSIRKYWVDENGNKDTTKDPSLIHLTYGKKDYNNGPWQINSAETTTERSTYYYTSVLAGGAQTPPVIDQLRVDGAVLDDMTIEEKAGETKYDKVYVYHYDYDGYRICVEADVQALQPHNINDAIKSIWGVQNVTVSGDSLRVN